MSTATIPADERKQVLTQDMLEAEALTIRADENGPDVRVYASQTEEGAGFPLRADDEWCIDSDETYGGAENDGLWMETETSDDTEITILKGVCIRRNVRRAQTAEIQGDAAGIMKTADQPLDVSDATVPVQEATPLDASAATVPVEPQSPVGQEDSSGSQIDPLDESSMGPFFDRVTDAGTYATIAPGAYGAAATVVADTSGAAILTVEVSNDGATWTTYDVDIGGANGAKEDVSGFAHVRAQLDSNVNSLAVSAKGV